MTSIGNNNYHIQLNNDKLTDRHYLGVTVLDNKVVKAWYADYRTKPRAKLPAHYLESHSGDISRKLKKHSRKHHAFINKMIELLNNIAPQQLPQGVNQIQDPKDMADTRRKFENLTNEQLYNIGISIGAADKDDKGNLVKYKTDDLNLDKQYEPDEYLTWNTRLVKDEYIAILLHILSDK